MATAALDTNPASRAVQDAIQDALQDLINSCRRSQNQNDQSPSTSRFLDVKRACEELRHGFPFHTEKGRRLVIGKLTKLNGNYVVKIIRNGLSCLSRMYYGDAQAFENEATKLVKLCCLQYSMQNDQDDGHLAASPANIIDWTAELCDELMRPPNEDLPRQDVNPNIAGSCLVKYLSKFADLYKSITSIRMQVPTITGLLNSIGIEPFKPLFEALKPRIHFEEFDELIQQTEAVVKTEKYYLDVMKFSSIGAPKMAVLLDYWISLLKFPFVTNWFALKTAEHDFLVHDSTYAQSLPFSDHRTYGESLIRGVYDAIRFLNSSTDQFKVTCTKARLQVFFDNSEVLLRHTVPCMQLMKSEVRTNLIEEIFLMLGITLNRALLPGISEKDKEQCESLLKSLQKILLSPEHLDFNALAQLENVNQAFVLKGFNHMSSSRAKQTASFDAITRALLSLPDKEQVLKVLQIWKRNFPDDTCYTMLSEIFALIDVIIQTKSESMSNHMQQFVNLLLQIPNAFFLALPIWRCLFEWLMASLPSSCYGPEILNLIRIFIDLHFRNLEGNENENPLQDVFVKKVSKIHIFLLQSMKESPKSEKVKIEALRLGLELFEEVAHPEEYEFALNVILSVASDMEANRIKPYTLNLLQTARAHSTRIEYPIIWKLLTLIDSFRSIGQKPEILDLCLALLQRNRGDGVVLAVNVCCNFLKLGVSFNTDNCKRFFTLAAEGRLDACQFVVNCLYFNHKIFHGDRMNEHVAFLLTIPDETLSSNTSSCQLLFKVIHDCFQLQLLAYTSIDVFELIVASIAGSIAVGTFDRTLNETVLKVLLELLHSRKLDNPGVIFKIYFYLMQTLRRASLGKIEDYTQVFATGLCMIVRLPLPLLHIKWLIQQVITILNQERITDKEEVWHVMVHMFKMGNNASSNSVDINPSDLEAHFKKLLKPSIVRNTAKIAPIYHQKELHLSSEGVTLDAVFSLSDLLVERMPSTFANKTSADLFKFLVKGGNQNSVISSFILPVAEAVLKENASEDELKTEIKVIEEKLLHVPLPLIPVIAECMRQYYLIDVSEAKKINVFILQILECFKNWQLDLQDTCTIMIGNILNIPKQLVQAFLEAPNASKEIKSMTRIIDSVSKLDPLILNGKFLIKFGKELHGWLIELIQHDFLMLLLKTSLKVSDVCTVLAFYLHLKMEDLLLVLTLSRKADMKSENTKFCWLSKYDQHQVLTPGNMVYLVIAQLRRLRIPDSDLGEKSIEICSQLLTNSGLNRQVHCGCLGGTFFEEYIEFFVLVLNQSSSLSKIEHWLSFLPHHAVQCKKVILAVCSWKGSSAERREEAVGRMIDRVSKVLLKLLSSAGPLTPSCYATLAREIEVMELVITKAEDEEIVYGLLDLIFTSWHLTEACLAVVLPWSKEEGLIFIEKMKDLYKKRKEEITLEQIDSEMAIPLEILPFAAKAYPNSAVKVVDIFTTMFELGGGLEDPLSLGRIPVWYKQMTDAGYPSQVIESWCTSLVHAQNLCSSDVDAITNITPETIKLLNKESDEIGRCLFSVEAPRTWKSKPDTDDTNTEHRKNLESFKRCLFLARLLNELASIAGCLITNPKVTQKVKDCTKALCSGFLNKESSSGNLYKIRYNHLKDLFVLLFGEEDGAAREQSMMQLMSQEPLSRSLFVLFRRLARTFASKPTVLAVTRDIIDVILNRMTDHSLQYQEVQRIISEKILSLEPNQDAIHTLQAAGYNQSTSITEDLWYSSSIQMPGYITMIASDNSLRLERSLRQLLIEWRAILMDNNISEIELDAKKVKTSELFKPSDSLETIESQLVHVKQTTRSLTSDNWSSFRRRQLIRNERRLRTGIEEQKKQIRQTTASKMTKIVIVWENQLLETVKTCSEKIPGCYAQNGFHSEKPVICGLAVDNRILTLYKQDDGDNRTEMENVEVKLYPAGMVVFGQYGSIHPYDTEQMWAAFYKMLLDKHLVPKIFLTNVSPGFDWIKQFVEPESSPPQNINFQSCCNLIPQSEDFFDNDPNLDVHISHTELAGFNKKELIILTPENAIQITIPDVKPPNRNTVIRQNIDTVVLHLQENDRRLQEMHPDSHGKILDRLKFAIRNALVIYVDGGEPTEESISSSINMEKLLFGCQDGQQYCKRDYAAIILDAVRTVTGSLQGNNRCYDGGEHVEFLP